jgi:hypothetical protein
VRSYVLSDIVAYDAETGARAVVLDDPPQGALGVSGHEISLVQHDNFEGRAWVGSKYHKMDLSLLFTHISCANFFTFSRMTAMPLSSEAFNSNTLSL